MYEQYYGLSSKPFQLNPDPSFYFASKQHRRAKAYLDYGVLRNEGFIVITGEIGAGKTTIVRGLLDSLDATKVVAGNVVSTQLEADDTLRMVAAAFGVRTKDSSKADVLMALEAFLVGQTVQGKRCLLIVDEAQNLTPPAVEELRMLSNFQFGNQALLQSFLVGQPEFRNILQHPQMQQLRQRVIAACHIGPLDQDETRGYIEHRLKCAGGTGRPQFEAEAFIGIFEGSGGIPRRINAICDRLLLLGFLSEKETLTAEDVQSVTQEIREESGSSGVGYVRSNIQDLGPVLEGDASHLRFDPAVLDSVDAQISSLDQEQHGDRLQRLERSLLRLERINLELLAMLKKLVGTAKRAAEEKSS
ncbi:XrtA/PEP-CTERM system-associated ATPase [Pseudorhodoferax sp. Leaf267]|uniref:XrtA/PEP-CTERM system-associated ATPase n=1 Tax=Pseudorhodoferax sp. Leaf267 TaxID=1736316 RepID=UPI0006F7092F|nr:XrtA/PEP-CTERM system-associated ATPase [Pseudorhodoferax sp. Leaf267]KQP23158.1 ATPase [Pseudorhodoferax sp. Leaf267]